MLLGSRFNGVWDEAVEKTDARRVAPISACVSSNTKRYHPTLALMGATCLASGHFSTASSRVVFFAASYREGSEGEYTNSTK